VRLWGTYYGGGGQDLAHSCVTDAANNVYMGGQTSTSTGAGIGTTGSHQATYQGGAYDGFVVKFNSAGIRQWGTYCGGPGDDYGEALSQDPAGAVFLGGTTNSAYGLGTSFSHQVASAGGLWDGFLVKFSTTNGSQQWGTFYGSPGDDRGFGCAADASGNVYLSGFTSSTASIATTNGHQPAFGGTGDAFLVKFNSSGVRQWGTYYGGSLNEWAWYCCTDPAGNVYITGDATTTTGTAVASSNGHQPAYGGGSYDGFLVKFNTGGTRQWGTYYGGAGEEIGLACAADAAGNAYMVGLTNTATGTAIATPGSHQPVHGGGAWDMYLVKFDVNGVRQSGTYYGGTGLEQDGDCTTGPSGEVYIAGYTPSSSGTVIATPGSHQPVYGGGTNDAFLAKFDACDLAPSQPSAISSSVTCEGITNTFSTAPAVGAITYTWSLPAGWTGSGSANTITLTPGSSGVFTLVAGNFCGVSPEQTVNVTVYPNPTVTINSGTMCSGQSFTLSGNGASTYTYSSGPVVSPNFSSNYTVTGTSAQGCSARAVAGVTVYQTPTVLATSGAICFGQSYFIIANGAITYTYSGGQLVSPTLTSTYTVTGTGAGGCLSASAAITTVTVHQLPAIGAITSNTLLCAGEEATLTGTGGTTYTFEPGGTGTSIIVSPSVTATYTVSGKDGNGCMNSAVITQSVDACTGIRENGTGPAEINVYPNPTDDVIYMMLRSPLRVTITNGIGQLVYSVLLEAGSHQVSVKDLGKGMYVLSAEGVHGKTTYKVIKE
jgi:hypothetical protein